VGAYFHWCDLRFNLPNNGVLGQDANTQTTKNGDGLGLFVFPFYWVSVLQWAFGGLLPLWVGIPIDLFVPRSGLQRAWELKKKI